MNFYHTWIYEYFLNTSWFVWTIVIIVIVGNLLGPIILWFVMSGKSIPFFRKRSGKEKLSSS